MYLIKTEVRGSTINGKGVFTLEAIKKGDVVWKFVKGADDKMTTEEYENLNDEDKKYIEKVGYLSPLSNMWVFPSKDDNAKYTNHSNVNNLTAIKNIELSEEIYFIANRNINLGEELTNNYHEFDEFVKSIKPDWAE
ncbi:MAG: hypothetical protein RI935_611 [Candidatus Parcubacteria bacterium]|jgi:SET domain-containing protein